MTQHHGHERVIHFGPRAKIVVKEFLKRDLTGYLFAPADAEQERREAQHVARKTPMSCGNTPDSKFDFRTYAAWFTA